ncbi:hypothetical protein [Lactococcus lactis]|jgi:hypothetical protein|uniref:hypothetical protein n=1 Tax=Lactococcus lactis TaxID=1358 RepID=UPI0021A8F5BB|nr:hypothetical protein [Lactococcus lactis]MCT3133003.1 hypothetical protein [Lactococcus lactis]
MDNKDISEALFQLTKQLDKTLIKGTSTVKTKEKKVPVLPDKSYNRIIEVESHTAKKFSAAERSENAKAARQDSVNTLIEKMTGPLEGEQGNKIKYRGRVLIGFLVFFLVVTLFIFGLIFCFWWFGGLSNTEVKVSQFLVTGFFVNLITLAIVVFKYLFDDKNSLMKDMIQLIVETLKENK